MGDSALVGQPPANDRDYWIVKGLYATIGKPDADASKGIVLPPPRPPHPSHHTKGPSVIAGLAVCIFVCIAITAGRVLARYLLQTSRLGWDDFFIVIAAVGATVWFALVIAMVPLAAAGSHVYNATYMNVWWFHRIGSVDLLIFFIAVCFAKMSIVCFNARLTAGFSKVWIWIHRTLFALIVSYLLVCIFWSTFRCNSPVASGDYIVAGKHAATLKCKDEAKMGLVLSVIHVVLDWILLSIPIFVLSRSNISLARKLRCTIPLSVGALSCVGSILRLYYQLKPLPDLTYAFPTQLPWTELDLTSAIIVTSLPSLNSVIAYTLPRKLRKYWGSEEEKYNDISRRTPSSKPSKNKNNNGSHLSTFDPLETHAPPMEAKRPSAATTEAASDKINIKKTIDVDIDMDEYPIHGAGSTPSGRLSEETLSGNRSDLENQLKLDDQIHTAHAV